MIRIPLYQVDAFASEVFSGNPAAVCPLDRWLPDSTMQAIARENNLSETAFFVRDGSNYQLRWFTPEVEIDLCGHATLAAAAVIFDRLRPELASVTFSSRSGALHVTREQDRLALDFPSRPPEPTAISAALVAALGAQPVEVHRSRDLLAVFASEREVRALRPSFDRFQALDAFGVIATAKGDNVDFVSRYFAPGAGVFEDPVTGSAHCTLIPYCAQRLQKTVLLARQVSARGGELFCEDRGERVSIAGRVAYYLEGAITVPE
jgi:PhzF family phenazine biosynthesis protein